MRLASLVVLLLLVAPPVSAEVSDKIPTIPNIWGLAIAGFVGSCLALRFTPLWLGIPLAVVVVYPSLGSLLVITDPYVGPAAIHEQGMPYAISAVGGFSLSAVGVLCGVLWRRAAKQRCDINFELQQRESPHGRFLGRVLSTAAMRLQSRWVRRVMLFLFGRYCRIRPLRLSCDPTSTSDSVFTVLEIGCIAYGADHYYAREYNKAAVDLAVATILPLELATSE